MSRDIGFFRAFAAIPLTENGLVAETVWHLVKAAFASIRSRTTECQDHITDTDRRDFQTQLGGSFAHVLT